MKILTIIVTYNGMHYLKRCISSIMQSSIKTDILIVDNGSTDGSVDFIKDNFPQVRLIQSGENLGFGAANNIGLRLALHDNYDYVYLLNQDAYLKPDTIEGLIKAHTGDFGILSPIQLNADGKLDENFRRKCTKAVLPGAKPVEEVDFVMAAHWLISIEAVRLVGCFSPVFKQYGEDDNYIHRLHYNGLKAGVVTTVSGIHDRGDRPASKQTRMKLKCVSTIVKLSNPLNSFWLRALLEPMELVAMSLKNLSLAPVLFIPTLLKRYPEIFSARKSSLTPGTFI